MGEDKMKWKKKKIKSNQTFFTTLTLFFFSLSFNSFRVNSSMQCTFSHWRMTFHGCCNVNHRYIHIILIIFAKTKKKFFTNHIHFVCIPFRIDLPSLSFCPCLATQSLESMWSLAILTVFHYDHMECVISIFEIQRTYGPVVKAIK